MSTSNPIIRLRVSITLCMSLAAYSVTAGPGVDSCYTSQTDPYLYYGSHTSYEVARNPQGIPQVPGCEPVQVWMTARHGAQWHNPAQASQFISLPDLRDQVLLNHRLNRGSLCEADLVSLRGWRQFLASAEEEDALTPQGRHDSRALGVRMRQAYWQLIENSNSSSDFLFRHTEMHRTKETAEHFAKGLFRDSSVPKFPDPIVDDRLIQAFENCPAWSGLEDQVRERVDQFVKSGLMQEVHHNISSRLGFNYNLPHYVVEAVFNSCSYEAAWDVSSRPAWCSAFTRSELQVLEYLEDLKYYHRTGHGDHASMNNRLGCPLVRDMMTRFMAVERGESQPAGVFYFTEGETVGVVATRLGLLATRRRLNYSPNRRYRTSALTPFGGNIISTLYKCSSGERYRVMFLVSEHVVSYPGCPAGLCPLALLKRKFGRVIRSASCSDQFCFQEGHPWFQVPAVELWAIIALVSTVLFFIKLMRAVNKLTE